MAHPDTGLGNFSKDHILPVIFTDISSWWPVPVTRNKQMACTRQSLNLHLFPIIFPSLSLNGDCAAFGVGRDALPFLLPPESSEPTMQGGKRLVCWCGSPSFLFSTWGEGKVLILQKRLCKKGRRRGRKKKKTHQKRLLAQAVSTKGGMLRWLTTPLSEEQTLSASSIETDEANFTQ